MLGAGVEKADAINAVRLFRKAALKKNSHAEFMYACALAGGIGTERNIEESEIYAKRSAVTIPQAKDLLKELRLVLKDEDGCDIIPDDLSSFR